MIEPDAEAPVLRLFRFRPKRPEFDAVLRDTILPDLLDEPGLVWALAGRQGPGETGERLVASLWESHAAMVAAVGVDFALPRFHPEFLSETDDQRLDIAPLAVSVENDVPVAPRIARLVVGRTKPGRLSEYLERAAAGARADIAAGAGPLSLQIVLTGSDEFRTLSTWGEWSNVARATGGSVDDPDLTRHTDLLERWQADHYEVVSLQRAAVRPEAPSSARVDQPRGALPDLSPLVPGS